MAVSKNKRSFSKELVAPCGMNCNVCKFYLAESRSIPKRRGLSHCAGCRPRGKLCAYLKGYCQKMREGTITFCYECSEFPCRRLSVLDRRYRRDYATSTIGNLEQIRDLGLQAWLESEEKKWRCGKCGGVISIHDRKCYDCEVK